MSGAGGQGILVCAGEPSGDLHGAPLVTALRAGFPGALLEGCGGPRMAASGLQVVAGIDRLSAIGFLEAVRTVPRHVALLRRLVAAGRAGRYQLAILIDYPGFHLRLGEALRRAGVRVLYYVAPQLWAWRPGRIGRLKRAVDRLAVVLPFEADWFGSRGVDCRFVGHPLLDQPGPDRGVARRELEMTPEARVLGIFPGSRTREIERNWPLFREVARRMMAEGRCTSAIVAGTQDGHYPGAGEIRVVRNRPDVVLGAATAVLVKSGTSTLEAALAGTPMVVGYRSGWSTYAIARRLMTVDRISLVNLVAGQDVVPEFWHLPVSPAAVGDALAPLLDPGSVEHGAQLAALRRVRERLGSPGAAGRVAELAGELLA
jgi:lipid-A-disaccharide synthase